MNLAVYRELPLYQYSVSRNAAIRSKAEVRLTTSSRSRNAARRRHERPRLYCPLIRWGARVSALQQFATGEHTRAAQPLS